MYGECSVLSWLHDVNSKLASWKVLYSAKGWRRISTSFSSYCTSLAVSIRWGKRLGLVQNSWNCHCWLPSVFEPPKPIRGMSWAFHAPCFLWPQVFCLLLLLTGFCFHSPSEHMGCAHGPWEHNSCGSEGGHTSLLPVASCTSLHISVCGGSA